MWFQHGDVILTKVNELPTGATQKQSGDSVVIAYGEATGHTHTATTADVEIYVMGDLEFLVCPSEAKIAHQEHSVAMLPAGIYRIGRVTEFDHFAEEARAVVD